MITQFKRLSAHLGPSIHIDEQKKDIDKYAEIKNVQQLDEKLYEAGVQIEYDYYDKKIILLFCIHCQLELNGGKRYNVAVHNEWKAVKALGCRHIKNHTHNINTLGPSSKLKYKQAWYNLCGLFIEEVLARNSMNHWPKAVASLKAKGLQVGNKQHTAKAWEIYRPVAFRVIREMIADFITHPLPFCNDMAAGSHISCDGGEMGSNKCEYTRNKYWNYKIGIFQSTATQVQHIKYDEDDIKTQETGEALALNKIDLFESLGIDIKNKPWLLTGANADTVYHKGHRDVLGKLKKMIKSKAWFVQQIDPAHLVELVMKFCKAQHAMIQIITRAAKTLTSKSKKRTAQIKQYQGSFYKVIQPHSKTKFTAHWTNSTLKPIGINTNGIINFLNKNTKSSTIEGRENLYHLEIIKSGYFHCASRAITDIFLHGLRLQGKSQSDYQHTQLPAIKDQWLISVEIILKDMENTFKGYDSLSISQKKKVKDLIPETLSSYFPSFKDIEFAEDEIIIKRDFDYGMEYEKYRKKVRNNSDLIGEMQNKFGETRALYTKLEYLKPKKLCNICNLGEAVGPFVRCKRCLKYYHYPDCDNHGAVNYDITFWEKHPYYCFFNGCDSLKKKKLDENQMMHCILSQGNTDDEDSEEEKLLNDDDDATVMDVEREEDEEHVDEYSDSDTDDEDDESEYELDDQSDDESDDEDEEEEPNKNSSKKKKYCIKKVINNE